MQKKVNLQAANKVGVSTKSIRRWKKKEFKFLGIKDPLTRQE